MTLNPLVTSLLAERVNLPQIMMFLLIFKQPSKLSLTQTATQKLDYQESGKDSYVPLLSRAL